MKLYESMALIKEDPLKRATDGDVIIGFSSESNQFYEKDGSQHIYFKTIATKVLFEEGWHVI